MLLLRCRIITHICKYLATHFSMLFTTQNIGHYHLQKPLFNAAYCILLSPQTRSGIILVSIIRRSFENRCSRFSRSQRRSRADYANAIGRNDKLRGARRARLHDFSQDLCCSRPEGAENRERDAQSCISVQLQILKSRFEFTELSPRRNPRATAAATAAVILLLCQLIATDIEHSAIGLPRIKAERIGSHNVTGLQKFITLFGFRRAARRFINISYI